ncbi:MAG: hypothetical protein ACM3XN_08565 [Chloroflexota bacterium]
MNRRQEEAQRPETATVEELRQSLRQNTPTVPKSASDLLTQTVSQMQNSLREQQLCAEQQLQGTLAVAAGNITDAQTFSQLQQLCGQLSQAISTGPETMRSNSQQLTQVVQQLSATLADQTNKSADLVAAALNQALGAMSQAQSAMFQNRALTELSQQIKQCNQLLRNFTSPADTLH